MSKSRSEIIYGIHAVESALRHHPETVLNLWIIPGKRDRRMAALIDTAKQCGISVEPMSADKMKKKCDDGSHQGVVASLRANKGKKIELEDVLDKSDLLLLILDEVQDPHNIGACLRTADAAAVDAVVVSKNRSPGLTAVVRKVASGAAETVPFVQVSNLARAMQQMRDAGVWIVGTSDDAEQTIFQSNAGQRMALVMGSEGKGMRRLTREHCDELVSIPMRGSVESLNVSVATGVCLYELRRQIEPA